MKTTAPFYLVDAIGELVAKVQASILAKLQIADPNISEINYQYGPIGEINQTLITMSQQQSKEYKRYPLFALVLPTPEQKGQAIGINGTDPLRIIIARSSNTTDKTPARYERNFKPILYPIYLEFIHQIDLDKRILTKAQDLIPHTKIDWPFYDDGQGKNVFADAIDAIEIKDLVLKFKLKQNLKN